MSSKAVMAREPVSANEAAAPEHAQDDVQPFDYGEVAGGSLPDAPGTISDIASDAMAKVSAEETLAREQAAERRGEERGEAAARGRFDTEVSAMRDSLGNALREFIRERGEYYQQVEREVVQLALSIARQVIHREAQVDPLLLAGIVRVALEKIESRTGVVVKVHPSHIADWRSYFAHHLQHGEIPELIEDTSLDRTQCEVRTALGTADLGLEVQLKEIEHGLMDLLAQRPQTGAAKGES